MGAASTQAWVVDKDSAGHPTALLLSLRCLHQDEALADAVLATGSTTHHGDQGISASCCWKAAAGREAGLLVAWAIRCRGLLVCCGSGVPAVLLLH
jgi:hypothetical protein